MPELIRRSGAQVLISAGNFALWRSPIPQILLSRNSLYTSSDFLHDVRARGDYALWADTVVKGWLARRSIGRAEITVAPSEAFAQQLSQWSGRKVFSVHHGFDADSFTRDATPLPAEVQEQLEQHQDALRLLFVSHYNYYRNFETLFRAIPILRGRLRAKKVKLFLTCRLNSAENPGTYRADSAATLASELRGSHDIIELGVHTLSVTSSSLSGLPHLCHPGLLRVFRASTDRVHVERSAGGGIGFAGPSGNLWRRGNLFPPLLRRCFGRSNPADSGIAGPLGGVVAKWPAAGPRLQLERTCGTVTCLGRGVPKICFERRGCPLETRLKQRRRP